MKATTRSTLSEFRRAGGLDTKIKPYKPVLIKIQTSKS